MVNYYLNNSKSDTINRILYPHCLMKQKISLSSLSAAALSRQQENAIIGGSGACACSYVCLSCICLQPDANESSYNVALEMGLERTKDSILQPIPPVN